MKTTWKNLSILIALGIWCMPQVTLSANLSTDDSAIDPPGKSAYKHQINKKQAKDILMKDLMSDAKYAEGSMEVRSASECMLNVQVNSIFPKGVKSIEESRLKELINIAGNKPSESMLGEIMACMMALIPVGKREMVTSNLAPISTDDFRLDYSSLKGKKVLVEGEVLYMMNIFTLKKNNMDLSPILIDVSNLPRDEQKKILQECATLTSVCKGVVYGIAGKVMYQNGIIAEGIQWKNR